MKNDETGLYFIIIRQNGYQKEETYSIDKREKLQDDMFFLVKW